MSEYSKAEPRFDIDLKFGQAGEEFVRTRLRGIVDGNGLIEVKTKRYLDLEFYVETHCDKGRTGLYQPSGISTTTASTWAFNIERAGITIIIPTVYLRDMLDAAGVRDREEKDGDCPTRGKLINLATLLYRLKQLDGKQKAESGLSDAEWNAMVDAEIEKQDTQRARKKSA